MLQHVSERGEEVPEESGKACGSRVHEGDPVGIQQKTAYSERKRYVQLEEGHDLGVKLTHEDSGKEL